MKNIIDYAAENKAGFEQKEFNAVDSLILSQLSYLNFDGLVPDLSASGNPVTIAGIAHSNEIDSLFRYVRNCDSNRRLFYALAESPRFCNVRMTFYVNKIDSTAEKQFSAVTYLLDDGTAYVAYRGTDSTFVGWKEDFNMGFMSPVPSQEEGVKYLNCVAGMISCDLKIGGHSKGGNIAVYSAIKCNRYVKNRITRVFNHDGPGFREEIYSCPEYLTIKDRIHKTIPQSSVIGMLLHNQENYTVVKSNRFWIMQHDPFSWQIDDNDFCYVKTLNSGTVFMNKAINKWIGSLDDDKRELFVDTLYRVIKATGASTLYDLTEERYKKAASALKAIKNIDEETRNFVLKTIGSLFILAARNLRDIQSGK